MLDWQTYPKRGTSWIETNCKSFRIVKAFNRDAKQHEGWPEIWPEAYVLYDMRKRSSMRLICSFRTLTEAKHEAQNLLPAHDTRESA